jgi:hypothetical protein
LGGRVPDAILEAHLQITPTTRPQRLDRRLDRLQTAIERGGVDSERFRVEGRAGEVRGELVRLAHAVRGQAWVDGVSCWCWEGGVVGAGARVDGVV